MSCIYLVHRKSGYSFLFRSIIPTDLQAQLGCRQFQLSLKCGIRHQAKSLALHLYNLTQQIYASIRQSPAKKQLTPEQIKERLKLELGNIAPSNQAITANQKLVGMADITTSTTEEANNKISLAELSQRYLQAKTEAGYPSKTINGYLDTHKLAISVLGDVAISYEIINKRSKNSNFFYEFDKMWIHGYLHLLGHDHKKKKDFTKMKKLEEKILNYFHKKN